MCGHFVPVRRNRDHLGRQRKDKEEGSKGGRYHYIVSFLIPFLFVINTSILYQIVGTVHRTMYEASRTYVTTRYQHLAEVLLQSYVP